MKKFLLFSVGIIAVLILIAHIGPSSLLGVRLWLLYLVFKTVYQN